MKFSELQKLMQEGFGIDHLADIARQLDVSAQAVSNWKSRDRVPYKYVINVREQINKKPNPSSEKNKKDILNQSNQIQYFEEDTVSS